MSTSRNVLAFPSLQRRSLASATVRWLTLLSFTAGTVGVPLEPLAFWGTAPNCAKRPGEVCRCSAVSRTLGRCCCARGAIKSVTAESASERSQPTSCCLSRQVGTAKTASCCAKSAAATADAPTPAALSISACGCGPSSPAALLLLCGDPRVLPAEQVAIVAIAVTDCVTAGDQSPRGERPRPAVPPPKSLPA